MSSRKGPTRLDHEATWLLGHTEQIDFLRAVGGRGRPLRGRGAPRRVPLPPRGRAAGRPACAHGFEGPAPRGPRREPQPRQLGGDRFVVVEDCRNAVRDLPPPARPCRCWATAPPGSTPARTAPCRTADNTRKAACCRDLQVEIMCTRAQRRLEALVRSRRSPYLCKIERAGDYSLEVEMISACGYLGEDGVACSLHGRHRADGRPAKPDLCFEWPPKNRGTAPGLRLRARAGAGPAVRS